MKFLQLAPLFASLLIVACRAVSPQEERSNFASIDGLRVHWVERGSGANALVFVHGWCCDASVWSKQLAGFAEWRRIAIDLPGCGASSVPDHDLRMDDLARAVIAVLDAACVHRAVLVGHSNGTPVVRQVDRLAHERVAALVIVDGSLRPFFTKPEEAERFIAPMRASNWREQVAAQFVDPMLKPMHDASERAAVREHMLAAPQSVAIWSMLAVVDPSIWNDDPIRVPTLALMARSPFWTPDYQSYARKLAPGIEWHELDGVSHFVMLDAPGEFEVLTRAFLARTGFRS